MYRNLGREQKGKKGYKEKNRIGKGETGRCNIMKRQQKKKAVNTVVCEYKRGQSRTVLLGWGGEHTESKEA